MRETVRELYEGGAVKARVFRFGLFVFDLATIAYFLATATSRIGAGLLAADVAIGFVVLADLAARFWIADNRLRFALSLSTLADLVVIASLAAPIVAGSNLGFLRILRVLRLVRTFRLTEQFDSFLDRLDVNTRISVAALNLLAFIFVATSIVWVVEHDRNPNLNTLVDALYFTITTLTTTGYGDITLEDRAGRLLTIFMMIFGVGFFLQLLQAIYRPSKANVTCPECGLRAHDRDATHCKHCGHTIYIETEGDA